MWSLKPPGACLVLIQSEKRKYLSLSQRIWEHSGVIHTNSFCLASKLLGLLYKTCLKEFVEMPRLLWWFRWCRYKAKRVRRPGEATGMGRGWQPSFLFEYHQILILECAKEREDVNNSNCLQDAGSNLNMIKLIWFYRLEFLSDRNWWG